jgi:predicted transcriptional regulator
MSNSIVRIESARRVKARHTVRSVMSARGRFIPSRMSVRQALQVALDEGVHYLPVGTPSEPLGIVCTCILQGASADALLSSLVTASTHSVRLDVSCRVAADSMLADGVGAMFVTQHGRVCGVVTQEALAKSNATGLRPLAQEYCACCASTAYLQVDTYDQLLCHKCRCSTAKSATAHATQSRDRSRSA